MKTAAITIIAKNYLAFARVLMSSIAAANPELLRIVILTDRIDGCFDPRKEEFEVVLSQDLGIPDSRWFHFKYTILELSTAVKPYAIEYVFDRYKVDRALYFDPDICVYSGLAPILGSLDRNAVALTPHLTAPLADDRRPSDLDILRSGAYNLGFIGIRDCAESRRFLKWWQARLYDHCVVDLPAGLFVDQRWVDLVPGLFDGVAILRNPEFNVAYWNLAHRRIERSSRGFEVEGRPLCFFHFSGFDPENPHRLSRHQNRFTLEEVGDARELALEYRRRLLESGHAECRKWPYAFGRFENGREIPDMGRPAHHEAPELAARVADPFSEEGYRAFVDLWNQPIEGPDGKPSGVTRLAYRIYRARADVQTTMPDIFGGDLARFLKWVASSGKAEHALNDAFVEPVRNAILASEKQSEASASACSEKGVQAVAENGIWIDPRIPAPVEELTRLIGNGDARLHLSRLAKAVYESRPELQRYFPDPCGRDGIRFLAWFLTYGAHEYRLDDRLAAPLRTQWNVLIGSMGNPLRRLWYRSVYLALSGGVWLRRQARRTIDRARLALTVAGSRVSAVRVRAGRRAGAPGINFIGYVESEMGVGESVRCAVRAADSVGLPAAVRSVDRPGPYRRCDRSIPERSRECPYPINVFHVNADQSETVARELGRSLTQERYNIGYWAWELEEFPDKWLNAFRHFDEIWTPSAFCQTAIARKSPIPVIRMPHAILVEECRPCDRASFSIARDEFVFVSLIDLLSVLERKNPLGLLAAFARVCAKNRKCRLILKVSHAGQRPREMALIREAARGLPVTIIDRIMDRCDVNGLIRMSDALVSLHRSEGFGLAIAEAMYLSKPVIATAYSGNTDFTKPDNAFLVGYDLVPAPNGCAPYDQGSIWAEPRLDDAAAQMLLAAANAAERTARATAGCEYIRRHFSPEAVGKMMIERLSLVGWVRGHPAFQASAPRRRPVECAVAPEMG